MYNLKLRENIYTTDYRKLLVLATVLPLIIYCSIILINTSANGYQNPMKKVFI